MAGAAGFLGLATVRSLSQAGHDVRGIVRRDEQLEEVRKAGGTGAVADVLRAETLPGALEGSEVVVHLAQAPGAEGGSPKATRVEGAANLGRVAARAGARRLVVGSGYWVYLGSSRPLTEESPVGPVGLAAWNFEAERAAREGAGAGGPETVVVRPGMVYGDGSWFREMLRELRDGSYRYIGDGSNRLSPIALEDAAAAFRAAVESPSAGPLLLAVDDEPVGTRTFAEFVAREIGAPPPRSIPREEADREWGSELAELNARDRAASNARLRSLGWSPRFPSYRLGVPSLLRTKGSGRDAGPGRPQQP